MERTRTPWKKSRTFGDIYGGRNRQRMTDNIFARLHGLQAPTATEHLPIFLVDNASRDFFFPINEQEICSVLATYVHEDQQGITHIWLRRAKTTEYRHDELPQAEFICGSGVRLITLYPWRCDLIQNFGVKKPSQKTAHIYSKFCSAPTKQVHGEWFLQWEMNELKNYMSYVLLHEIGHHVDWYSRRWSNQNSKKMEEFADQYAFQKLSQKSLVWNEAMSA